MKTVKLATFIENPDNPQTVTAEDFALAWPFVCAWYLYTEKD